MPKYRGESFPERHKTRMDGGRAGTFLSELCFVTCLKKTNALCCWVIWSFDCISCCCNKAETECFFKQSVRNIIYPAGSSAHGRHLTPKQSRHLREGKIKVTVPAPSCKETLWTTLGRGGVFVWSQYRLFFFLRISQLVINKTHF